MAALVGNTINFSALTVSAETAGQTEESSAVIVLFGGLSEEVREQLLPVGANESDIIFPDTLTVTVEKTAPEEETGTGEKTVSGGDAGEGTDGQNITEDITLENITWELDADNSASDTFLSDESANGYCYTYVPVLPETVTLTDSEGEVCDFTLTLDKNVYLPEIYVLVGDSGAKDDYPLLDQNHGTVYASVPCPSMFSNTDDLSTEEHANEYTVSQDDNSISAKCSKCGIDRGTITLTVGTITYDGQPYAATVDGTIEGATTSVTYQTQGGSDLGTSGPINAGTYKAIVTCTDADKSYTISAEFVISKADYAPNPPAELSGYAGELLSTVSLEGHPGWSWDDPSLPLPDACDGSSTYQASYMD